MTSSFDLSWPIKGLLMQSCTGNVIISLIHCHFERIETSNEYLRYLISPNWLIMDMPRKYHNLWPEVTDIKNPNMHKYIECIYISKKYKTVLVQPPIFGSSTDSLWARASRRRLVLVYYFNMALTLGDFNAGAFSKDKLLGSKPGF